MLVDIRQALRVRDFKKASRLQRIRARRRQRTNLQKFSSFKFVNNPKNHINLRKPMKRALRLKNIFWNIQHLKKHYASANDTKKVLVDRQERSSSSPAHCQRLNNIGNTPSFWQIPSIKKLVINRVRIISCKHIGESTNRNGSISKNRHLRTPISTSKNTSKIARIRNNRRDLKGFNDPALVRRSKLNS